MSRNVVGCGIGEMHGGNVTLNFGSNSALQNWSGTVTDENHGQHLTLNFETKSASSQNPSRHVVIDKIHSNNLTLNFASNAIPIQHIRVDAVTSNPTGAQSSAGHIDKFELNGKR